MRLGISSASASAGTGGIGIRIRSNFDIKWFQIAVAHERAAVDARKRAEAAAEGSTDMAEAFDDELQATMGLLLRRGS